MEMYVASHGSQPIWLTCKQKEETYARQFFQQLSIENNFFL